MTFSGKVKNELCTDKLYLKKCCNLAFLYGVFLFCKGYAVNLIKIQTENKSFVDVLQKLLLDIFNISPKIEIFDAKDGISIFSVQIVNDDAGKIDSYYNISKNKNNIDFSFLKKRCDKAAFLKGVFLSAGVVGDPDKNYHIEFLTPQHDLANDLCTLISGFSLNPKITTRKNSYIVYSKESDSIIDILNILGATNSAFRFMEIKVLKDVRNNVNRKVNFETANLSKTAYAAATQIEAIEKIQKIMGLTYLPDKLKQLAEIRLNILIWHYLSLESC